jgi:cytoskeletal protein CcmA (bactofilin family)
MFSNDDMDEASPSVVKEPSPPTPTLLSFDLTITGDLNCEGEVQIDGTVIGNIRSNVLNVGETASIDGEIIADSVTIYGRVTGQINARSVTLYKTAHVQGDILHEKLILEQGAYLDGHCRRKDNDITGGDNAINFLMKGLAKSNPPPKKTIVDTTAKA